MTKQENDDSIDQIVIVNSHDRNGSIKTFVIVGPFAAGMFALALTGFGMNQNDALILAGSITGTLLIAFITMMIFRPPQLTLSQDTKWERRGFVFTNSGTIKKPKHVFVKQGQYTNNSKHPQKATIRETFEVSIKCQHHTVAVDQTWFLSDAKEIAERVANYLDLKVEYKLH